MSVVPALKTIVLKTKRYTFEKILKEYRKSASNKNIAEVLSRYPNCGKGFNVFAGSKKSSYYYLYSTDYKVNIQSLFNILSFY